MRMAQQRHENDMLKPAEVGDAKPHAKAYGLTADAAWRPLGER
jgi:hypothetical protein